MPAEQITITIENEALQAMVNLAEEGWEAACRFPDADFMITKAKDRQTAIDALQHIMVTPLVELAKDVDAVADHIGAQWEIRQTAPRPEAAEATAG